MNNQHQLSQVAEQLHMNLTELQPIMASAGLHKASDLLGDTRMLSADLVEHLKPTPADVVAGYKHECISSIKNLGTHFFMFPREWNDDELQQMLVAVGSLEEKLLNYARVKEQANQG